MIFTGFLKSRAALAGKSLSDYLIAEIQRRTEYPTLEELRQRLRDRTPVQSQITEELASPGRWQSLRGPAGQVNKA